MLHPITHLDHPVIAVRDMEASRAVFERLGFCVSPRGSHLEWGTGNWCIMFSNDYLELRGVLDPGKYTHGLDAFLDSHGEGLMGLALGSKSADESRLGLMKRGLHPHPVRTLTRNFELPEGTVQPRFALCFLDPGETPGLMSVVICQHLTPELLRRQEWLQHANGALGVSSLTGTVRDLSEARQAHAKLFGEQNLSQDEEMLAIRVGDRQHIRLVRQDALRKQYPELTQPSVPRGNALVSIELTVADLNATAAFFRSQGITPSQHSARLLRLAPRDACGVVLDFVGQQ